MADDDDAWESISVDKARDQHPSAKNKPELPSLRFPNKPYNAHELDRRDPWFDEICGGYGHPDTAFYKSRLMDSPQDSLKNFTEEDLMIGFKLTPRQLTELDLKFKAKLIEYGAVHIKDLSSLQNLPAFWPAKQFFYSNKSVLAVLHSKNGYWAGMALQGWPRNAKKWLVDQQPQWSKLPEKTAAALAAISHTRKRPNHCKAKPASEYLLKHCYLQVTTTGAPPTIKYVPFTAFMTKADAQDGDLDISSAEFAVLAEPSSDFYAVDVATQKLVFEMEVADGDFKVCEIRKGEDFATALALRDAFREGKRLLKVRVVSTCSRP